MSSAVERAFREESGRVLATLIRHLGGDFQLAEDALQDAFAVALAT
ncbi:MAG: RNA polymerase subunit sigma-24, partial [Solirubrobacteraceae bacterium]